MATKFIWLTRDSVDGELDGGVDVWSKRPDRFKFLDDTGSVGICWLSERTDEDPLDGHVTRVKPSNVPGIPWTLPETDLECIRVGIPDDADAFIRDRHNNERDDYGEGDDYD